METWLLHGLAAMVAVLGLMLPSEVSSAAVFPSGPQTCPLESAKKNFDSSKFLGNWYVLEYQYAREMRLRDIGCVQLHYTAIGIGDIISNFTFRYPPKTGFFFHVAEISLLSDVQPSIWETQYGTIELISTVVDTDYDNWAVLVQCSKPPSSDSSSAASEPQFLSTRVLSRTTQPSVSDWIAVESAIAAAGVSAEHKFAIDQQECSTST